MRQNRTSKYRNAHLFCQSPRTHAPSSLSTRRIARVKKHSSSEEPGCASLIWHATLPHNPIQSRPVHNPHMSNQISPNHPNRPTTPPNRKTEMIPQRPDIPPTTFIPKANESRFLPQVNKPSGRTALGLLAYNDHACAVRHSINITSCNIAQLLRHALHAVTSQKQMSYDTNCYARNQNRKHNTPKRSEPNAPTCDTDEGQVQGRPSAHTTHPRCKGTTFSSSHQNKLSTPPFHPTNDQLGYTYNIILYTTELPLAPHSRNQNTKEKHITN